MQCAPSVLAANFARLEDDVRLVQASGSDILHLDVMDGSFVAPISFGEQMVAALKPHCQLPFDVHLMVRNPAEKWRSFVEAGADWITFHVEAEIHAHRLLTLIKQSGCRAGISLVPSTPVTALSELLDEVDLVLVMLVNPGYGGQRLLTSCLRKVSELRRLREARGCNYLISVDGGVNRETARLVAEAGADVAVCGTSFFQSDDPAAYCRFIRQLA